MAAAPSSSSSSSSSTAAAVAVAKDAQPGLAPTFTLRSAPLGMRRSSSVSGRPLLASSLPSSPPVFKESAATTLTSASSMDIVATAAAAPPKVSADDLPHESASAPLDGIAPTSSSASLHMDVVGAAVADISRLNLDNGVIDPRDLVALITAAAAPILLLDMRSFMLHNQAHIKDSINVCVPTTILKRNEFSVALVEKGICRPADRERWQKRAGADVILYDETTESTHANSTLVKLYHALQKEGVVRSARWLDGGMATFQKEYVDHCKVCCSMASKLFKRIDLSLACSAPKTTSSQTASGPNEPVQILSYLFLGGEKVASDAAMLHNYSIKYVLNAAVECDDSFPSEFVYLRLNLLDTPSQSNMVQIFDQAFKFIGERGER